MAKFLVFVALSLLCQSVMANENNYSLSQLRLDAAQFLQKHYQNLPHERIEVSVGNLDSRLKLIHCTQPLTMTVQDPPHRGGNISLHVQCETQNSWSVHLAAQVSIYQQVPITRRELVRGEQIQAEDITKKIINISEIRQSFHTNIETIIGKQIKRNLAAGDVFKSQSLTAPKVIQRGDLVVLEVLTGPIRVRSSATALSDGHVGEKIRVKNAQSQRIVMGEVLGDGLVRTQ